MILKISSFTIFSTNFSFPIVVTTESWIVKIGISGLTSLIRLQIFLINISASKACNETERALCTLSAFLLPFSKCFIIEKILKH